MQILFDWEEVNSTATSTTARAKVPGGWLVNVTMTGRGNLLMTNTFVADATWEWEIS